LYAEIARLKHVRNDAAGTGSLEQGCTKNSNNVVLESVPADSAEESLIHVTDPQSQSQEETGITTTSHSDSERSSSATAVREAARNPLLEDRPWFISLTPEMPILVGEATDAAFATKFRQALSGKTQSHFPRIQYTPNPIFASMALVNFPGPTPARARVLIKVALHTLCRRYHFVRKSAVLALLDQFIRIPTQCDAISTCKLFAIFALGEAYSARAVFPDAKFPGIDYYNHATNIFRVISEKPRIECVEVMALLVSLALKMFSTRLLTASSLYIPSP
jgi:proline utilization trans-activator